MRGKIPVVVLLGLLAPMLARALPARAQAACQPCPPGYVLVSCSVTVDEFGNATYEAVCERVGGGGHPTPPPRECGEPVRRLFCIWNVGCPPRDGAEVGIPAIGLFDCHGVLLEVRSRLDCSPDCTAALPQPARNNPCVGSGSGFTPGGFACGGRFRVVARASVPIGEVSRLPYPRGLIRLRNSFTLVVPAKSAEGWSDTVLPWPEGRDPQEGDIKDYRLGLRWVRLSIPARWNFDDGVTGEGDVVRHTYQLPSFGRSKVGIGLQGEPLPAYRVTVITFWQLQYRIEYDRWTQTGTEWSDCFYRAEEPLGIPHRACEQVSYWQIEEPVYGWEHEVDPDWTPIDLTQFGLSVSYYASLLVRARPTDLQPNPPVGYVGVPVIEVQGVIEH